MRQYYQMLLLLLSATFFSGCGANKKLETARAETERANATNADLSAKNNELSAKNGELQNQVNTLIEGNKSVNAEFSSYRKDCEITKADCQEMESELDEIMEALEKVAEKLKEAMADFEGKGVDVYYKDGLVYVQMDEALMYKSGSATLGEKGKSALSTLAAVLNDYPKLKVIVIGHTDDKQVKKGSDNWSLSTERANGIVRVLRDYKVDPVRLTAAGKGKYNPIADNSTEKGRAQNRRTEIILNPDIGALMKMAQDGK
jgi:chemotaxis protein MotB